ncbi:MAG: hypothetical protein HOB84_05920 [Candidatus Marinimicrobia bacterium]|jgi:hypothetical protein|nr:hypothetical protein [Candidatus Neomarinimicrobiota bacterium]MBT4033311.1 hypothetical protein [Candidatus Neomarinimicrobiota bacterium]MBT4360401.1 hypothetical protein [Candidatus Neomarinimicrobiota bacterium]MBT4714291.1 hypothetical protein [Candidatus Neomarinimicrobiota bacterium]MBT4944892.1 hypothetical protein [Candidatus Neomarinimicrobiota bacterium]
METQDSVLDVVHPVQSTVENHQALFSHDPERAYKEAQRLVSVVANRCTGPGYLVNIKGKQYPKIEWWTSVSASLGLFPRVLYSKRLEREGEIAYEAKVEVHRNGQIIASGEALCSSLEDRWRNADEYAIKSMAITRASGKAYRIPLSFLAVMAGLEVTPAEEMPAEANIIPHRDGIRTDHKEAEFASEKQISAVRGLIENDRVYPTEKRQISGFLEDGLTKSKAKELLDFFYGISEYDKSGGTWVKTSKGKLEERR